MEILVLEASTTSAKAMLYHTEDRSFEVKVRAYTGNYEDVTIHNAENVYLDMVSVGRELLDGRQVDMIALGGTWHSLVLCDGAVKPVTPVYRPIPGPRRCASVFAMMRNTSAATIKRPAVWSTPFTPSSS